jgi:GT2 family glycosyltransferase
MIMYDIAVVLINYNSSEHTIACVESIFEKTNQNINYQIIITDNNSVIQDYKNLKNYLDKKNYDNVIFTRSEINTGFGGGNMIGFNLSNAKHVLFLNNDTILMNDCLQIMLDVFEKNPEIGIAGGQAFKENGDFMVSLDHFASPTREIFGRSFLEKINPKEYPKRKKRYDSHLKINFVPGSFMFLRSQDFAAVGGFDTHIFLYYEETDLCLRLRNINKFAYLIPQAHFIHKHGVSTGKSIAIKRELKISLFYILRKHYGFFGFLSVWLFMSIKYFFSSLIKPKNWKIFEIIITGAPISKSLKTKQTVSTH